MRVLRRRRWLILLCLVVVTGSAIGYSVRQEKEYSAKAWLLFRDPAVDKNLFQSASVPNVDEQRQAATNLKLASLPDVADRTAKQLGGTLSGREIEDKIDVSGGGDSDVVSVTATDNDPAVAATLANVFARQFIAIRREADQAVIRNAQVLVQQRLKDLKATDRRALQSRADDLKILAALQTGKAELAQEASVPTSPSSPKPVRNGVLGGVLGLLLGVGIAVLLERVDRRLKDPRELAETYGLPVLAAIPNSRALRRKAKGFDAPMIQGPAWEAFLMLRAKLRYFNVDHNLGSVLITSAAAGEGKTTVASNLALAAAMAGDTRVLLLEADLRHPALSTRLNLAPLPGLAELLTHGVMIADATRLVGLGGWNGSRGTLDVIVAGATPPNPSELLESRRMAALLDQLQATYDLVVIDTPPVLLAADALPLMRHVAGVIAVSRLGVSTRDDAVHLRHELESFGAPTLGLVVNRVKATADTYSGYTYIREPEDPRTVQRVT